MFGDYWAAGTYLVDDAIFNTIIHEITTEIKGDKINAFVVERNQSAKVYDNTVNTKINKSDNTQRAAKVPLASL